MRAVLKSEISANEHTNKLNVRNSIMKLLFKCYIHTNSYVFTFYIIKRALKVLIRNTMKKKHYEQQDYSISVIN